MTKRKIWTVEEQQYLRQIWAGYSLSDLSYYLPFSPRAISQKAKDLGLHPKSARGSKAKTV